MKSKPLLFRLFLLLVASSPATVTAETFVIPFSDIRQEIDTTGGDPDAVIRAYLAGQIRDELDAQGFNVDGGLVFGEVPVGEITETIANDCNFPRPYQVHTDATTATITLDDSSSLTVALDSIRSIEIQADLTGIIDTDTTAWVRWGQDVIFVGDCKTINTDHGWVGLTLPMDIDLTLSLDLDPVYDPDQVAIIVDKHATLAGQAQFVGGNLRHDFGPISLTDLVLSVFEDELLAELSSQGAQAATDAIAALNYQLDGLDENGLPDPTIEVFNEPTTYVLSANDEDEAFIRDLLVELGIPEIVLAMVDGRGVEILLQLVVLEGAERDTYLASLGVEIGCEALFANYRLPLATAPLYAVNNQVCEVADLSTVGAYFSDALCANEIAFSPTDEFEYCQANFGPGAETTLGNAASWVPNSNQPGDELPAVPSRPWTTVPTSLLDLGVVTLQGNNQPFMKQLNYKTIDNVGRGTGTCELEMRVYKRDITDQGLKPLLALHGGTWRSRGSSFLGLEASLSQFTERGFIVFAPFYRLTGEKDGNLECNGASWHEVTTDAESAFDWVSQNGAAFGAAPDAISLFGQSAGAHLATWLTANRGTDVRKTLIYYGPTDALEFLSGVVPLGGPFEAYRDLGMRSLARFFGSLQDASDLHLDQISFGGLTPATLSADWANLIPDTVFDLGVIDPLAPPAFVARCAANSQVDLATINLALPPAELTACMKQDLSDFLVRNSFNHQLAANTTPVFILHGSADSVVPHAQAVSLCGAMAGTTFSPDVVDPLTEYSCGLASQAQIAMGADHALDLGFCVDPLCPGGAPGSDTRAAVATAIDASYAWLLVDDADGDGVEDSEDAFPNDPNESVDTDGDGVGNNADTDDDNDGLLDVDELAAGTNPENADTDSDGAGDALDNCPAIANADQHDADRDGLGNVCDAVNDLAPRDYNGDGKSDILWRHALSGEVSYWQMDGDALTLEASVATISNLDWQIAATGDYDGDGDADMLWRNTATGQNWMFLMDGPTIASSVGVNTVPTVWEVAGGGDYNGDGRSDILWRNSGTGQNWLYLMNGAAITNSAGVNTVPTVWEIAGGGDYNGDGRSDILWRNSATGQNWMYLMNGNTIVVSSGVNTVASSDWRIAGNGDYNGDGNADILWRNSATGQNWMYLMNGASISSSAGVDTLPAPWATAGSGDYDGDGRSDILWRNSATGENRVYIMDGSTIQSSQDIVIEPDLDRRIVLAD